MEDTAEHLPVGRGLMVETPFIWHIILLINYGIIGAGGGGGGPASVPVKNI